MLACVRSAMLFGVEGLIIDVQVHVAAGLPSYTFVGLPDAAGAARAVALEARFLESGMRRGLTLVHAAGQGEGTDRRIFLERRIDLRPASRLTLADRVRYDPGENILFLNFECLTLDTDTDTDAIIRSRIESGSGAMIRSRGGLGFPRRIRRPH